jgi:general stress protein 26
MITLMHAARIRIARAALLIAALALAGAARAELPDGHKQALAKTDLIYIATVRADGTQSAAAPIWFTTTDAGEILIQTAPSTVKAKRIRAGSPALIWIGTDSGPALIGKAEVTDDKAVQQKILGDFRSRYLRNRLGLIGPNQAKFDDGRIVAIKITPVRALPDGFAPAPGKPAPKLEDAAAAH